MAANVDNIISSMETQIGTTLGASYSKLNFVYDIEKNTFKTNPNRYGVVTLEAVNNPSIIKASTLDHVFQVVLTDNYVNSPANDLALQEAINNLYDKLNEVEVQFYQSKLGLPSLVMYSELSVINEPEIIEEHKIVALRGDFLVKYRTQVP